jgi:hypothetical protein
MKFCTPTNFSYAASKVQANANITCAWLISWLGLQSDYDLEERKKKINEGARLAIWLFQQATQ